MWKVRPGVLHLLPSLLPSLLLPLLVLTLPSPCLPSSFPLSSSSSPFSFHQHFANTQELEVVEAQDTLPPGSSESTGEGVTWVRCHVLEGRRHCSAGVSVASRPKKGGRGPLENKRPVHWESRAQGVRANPRWGTDLRRGDLEEWGEQCPPKNSRLSGT